MFSGRKLTGDPAPSKLLPLARGSFPDSKLWIGVPPGRGGILEAGISPTGQPAFFVCLSIRRGSKKRVEVPVGTADRQAGAQLQPLSCLELGGRISTSFACISAACIGGADSDQPEYQRCEAGMTSPRVCLLPEPCQATLPARSPPPPPTRLDNKLQPVTAGASQRAGWVAAGSQPGSGREPDTSLEPTSSKPWGLHSSSDPLLGSGCWDTWEVELGPGRLTDLQLKSHAELMGQKKGC